MHQNNRRSSIGNSREKNREFGVSGINLKLNLIMVRCKTNLFNDSFIRQIRFLPCVQLPVPHLLVDQTKRRFNVQVMYIMMYK